MTGLRVLALIASMMLVTGVLFVLAVGPSGHELRASLNEGGKHLAGSVRTGLANKPAKPSDSKLAQPPETSPATTSATGSAAKPAAKPAEPAKRQLPTQRAQSSTTPEQERRITYKAGGNGWKVESGYEGENIFWEKTKIVDGQRKTVRFLYPPSERRKYARMIANVDSQF